MYASAKSELREIESTLTPEARYRLWVHREAIRAYLDTRADEAIRVARAYSQSVSPIACELTVGALAVARRG
jgi:intracellular sulfur oxidation DsrE/DsrF family protein